MNNGQHYREEEQRMCDVIRRKTKKQGWVRRKQCGYSSLKPSLVVALAAAIPDLEKSLLRIRFRECTYARVRLLGAAKQRTRSVATAVVIPQRPVVLAIGGHPRGTNVFRRAMQSELHSDCIRTREVRVVRVNEEPCRFGPGA